MLRISLIFLNQFAALLSNWSTFEKILKDYDDGAGSAAEEAKKSATNWEGSLERLNNSWDSLVRNFVQTDKMKSGINLINLLVKALQGFINLNPNSISAVVTAIAGIAGFKGKGIFNFDNGLFTNGYENAKNANKYLDFSEITKNAEKYKEIVDKVYNREQNVSNRNDRLQNAISSLPNNKFKDYLATLDIAEGKTQSMDKIMQGFYATQIKNTQGLTGVRQCISDYNEIAKNQGSTAANIFAKAVGQTNKVLGVHLEKLKGAETSIKEYGIAVVGSKIKDFGKNLLSSIGNMGISMAVSWGVSWLFSRIEELWNKEEKLNEKKKELAQKTEKESQSYKESTNALRENIKTFVELRSKVNLTANEKQQLLSIQKSLSDSYGEEAKNLDLVNGKYDDQLKKLKKINKSESESWYRNAQSTRRTKKDNVKDNISNEIGYFRSYENGKDRYDIGNTFSLEDMPDYTDKNKDSVKEINKLFELLNKQKGIKSSKEAIRNSFTTDYLKTTYELTAEDSKEKVQDLQNIIDVLEKETNSKEKDSDYYKSMYNRLNELLQHYQKEVTEYNSALSDEAEAYISKFEDKNKISITNVGEDTYKNWKEALLSSIKDDDELKEAVEKKLKDIFTFDSDKTKQSFIGSIFNIAEYSESIDNIQSKINTLKTAFESLKKGSLSDSDKIDLIQNFPELTPYINDTKRLATEIQKLAQVQPNTLIAQLETLKKTLKTDNEVKQVDNLIQSLRKLGVLNVDTTTVDLGSKTEIINEYVDIQKKKVENVIKKLEKEKDVQQDILDNLNDQKEALEKQKEQLEDIISDYETAGNTVVSFIEKQVDKLNEQKDKIEEDYDNRIKSVEEEIEKQEKYFENLKKPYEDELSALQKKNDEISKSVELQKAYYDLLNAKNTKVRVYSESGGWTDEVDRQAVQEKQQAYNDLLRQKDVDKLQNKIDEIESKSKEVLEKLNNKKDSLEKGKENDSTIKRIENEIKAFDEYKDSFQEMVDSYTNKQNELTTQRILGVNWHDEILSRDTSIITQYGKEYDFYQSQLHGVIEQEITDKERQIEAQQAVIQSKEDEIQSWNDYSSQLGELVENINGSNKTYLENLDNLVISEGDSLETRKKNLQSIAGVIEGLNSLSEGFTMQDLSKVLNGTVYFDTKDSLLSAIIQGAFAGVPSFADGGSSTNTGLAMLHGTYQKSETIFNAEQSKRLYDVVNNNRDLSKIIGENINNQLNDMFRNGLISSPSNGSRTVSNQFVFTGDIRADDYNTFERCMNTYLNKAQMNTFVGK